MTKLPPHLLARSAEETSRRLCLGLLDDASSALERMDDPNDGEALHDFRVSLRRLRSLLRAYRAHLGGSAKKKRRDRVKTLAASTNVARDAEVQIAWLAKARETLGEPGASGASYLMFILAARQATTPSAATLRHGFRTLRRDLTKELSRVRLRDENDAANYVQATADVIREHTHVLETSLTAAHSAEDAELLHRARVEAKRLRYVIEPLQPEFADARMLIQRMKALQDVLGELQDTRVMTEEVSNALETSALDEARKLRDLALAAAELPEAYPPQNPGLLSLLKSQRTRRDRAFTELTLGWSDSAGGATFALIHRFVQQLLRWPEQDAPRRRFLLSKIPAELRNTKSQLVREGWLPGKQILESVRATREGRTVRYVRVIRQPGSKPVHEPLTRRGFDAFWTLTEARRLESRRYRFDHGAHTWTLISIPERQIVLAVVDGGAEISIPELVQTEMLREVTGVRKYELEALARTPSR